MSVISVSDFENWRSDPVTKAFYEAILDRIEEAKENLSYNCGLDEKQDNFMRGFITAYRECLVFRVDDLEETQVD